MANARLVLGTLFCHQTTEMAHDEVFAVVAARHSNGSTSTTHCPNGDGDADGGNAWDMNDSGPIQDRHLGYCLWQGSIDPGQEVNVQVVFMESDNVDYKLIAAGAGALLEKTGEPTAATAGFVLRLISLGLPTDEDDILGSFNVVLRNHEGQLKWTYSVAWNSPTRPTYPFADTSFFVHLASGRASYDSYMRIEYQQ